jgi:hypothetical protein
LSLEEGGVLQDEELSSWFVTLALRRILPIVSFFHDFLARHFPFGIPEGEHNGRILNEWTLPHGFFLRKYSIAKNEKVRIGKIVFFLSV